jgi:hypothetical protein
MEGILREEYLQAAEVGMHVIQVEFCVLGGHDSRTSNSNSRKCYIPYSVKSLILFYVTSVPIISI